MEGNLTKGPILKTLTKLAIPIMASSFLGTLYNITDMAWIGLLGSKAVAGIGVGGMFTWLSQGFASMARMGGQVQVAQCVGRGDKEKAHGYAQAAVQLATVMGLLSPAFSIIYFIVTLIRKATELIAVDGFTQTVILIVFFGGMQLFTIGIIGEYLAKNYIEPKRRPLYLAKEILDYKK